MKGGKRHLAANTEGNARAAGFTAAPVQGKTGLLTRQDDVVENPGRVRKVIAVMPVRALRRLAQTDALQDVEKRAPRGRFRFLPGRWIV